VSVTLPSSLPAVELLTALMTGLKINPLIPAGLSGVSEKPGMPNAV